MRHNLYITPVPTREISESAVSCHFWAITIGQLINGAIITVHVGAAYVSLYLNSYKTTSNHTVHFSRCLYLYGPGVSQFKPPLLLWHLSRQDSTLDHCNRRACGLYKHICGCPVSSGLPLCVHMEILHRMNEFDEGSNIVSLPLEGVLDL